MSFLNSTFGNSSNTNTSSFSSGLFGSNNQNQGQSSMFGSTNALGSKPMFGSTSTNNNGSSGGLFGNALQPVNNNAGGGLFGGSQNSNNGGGGLFGNVLNKDKENQGMGGGLFGGNNSTGGGLFGGNKENSGGMFGNGGGMGMGLLGGSSMPGTVGYHYDVSRLKKTNDGLYIQSVTAISNYAGKSLDELRAEDYSAMKNKQIPDQKLMELQNQWKKNQEGGGIGQTSSSGLGGGMFGNNNNNQNQGGGLFGGSNSTGGGLFGGSTQNNSTGTGGGLFGSSGNNNSTGTGGGLFGGQQNNNNGLGMNNNQSKPLFGGSGSGQAQTGGLFGGSTGGQSTGGLFGQSGGNTAGQSTGGLFGNNSGGNSGGLGGNVNGSGGLFGNNNNNSSQNKGGLFGQSGGNTTGQSTGGLFGSSGNQSSGTGSGLFGSNGANGQQQQTQTGGSGGLFGNSSGQGLASNTGSTGGATGGLFGNSGAQKGGLFGNSSSTQTAGSTTQGSGGLFSSGATNTTANTTAPGTGGLFSGSTAGGQSKGGLFSGSTTSGSTGGSTGGLFSGGSATGSTGQSGGLFSSGGQTGAAAQNGQNMQGLDQSVNSMTDVVAQYFGDFGQSLSAHEKARELYGDSESESLFSTVMKTKFPSYNPYGSESKSKKHYEYPRQKSSAEKKAQWGSKGKHSSLSFMNSTEKEDELGMNYIFKPQITDMKRIKVNAYQKQSPEKTSADLTRVYDSVSVYVVFQKENSEDKVYNFDVSLTNTCTEIKNYILKQVLNSEGLNFFQYKLLYKNKILKGQSIVKDIGLRDKDKLYLIPDLDSFGSSQVSTISSEKSSKSLAPENLIPHLTNNNQTVPSMLKLSRMSEDELASVENFVIYNENARITFPGKTDLRGMNLNELVVLGHRAVEVYPEDGNIEPPQVGAGLNKAAIIEFYKWPLPKKYQNNTAEYIAKLKRQSKAQNVQYRGYDAEHEMLVVSVANFSSKNHM